MKRFYCPRCLRQPTERDPFVAGSPYRCPCGEVSVVTELIDHRVRCPTCEVEFLVGLHHPLPNRPLPFQCSRCGTVFDAKLSTDPKQERAEREARGDVVRMFGTPPASANGAAPTGRTMVFGGGPPVVPPRAAGAIEQLLTETDVAPLWEAVQAEPTNDGPRLVLADALTERAEPLGEFISIQVTARGKPPRGLAKWREAELRTNATRWVPPGVRLHSAGFERGFLKTCTHNGPHDPFHWAWRLVEHVTFEGFAPGAPLPELPHVVEAWGLPPESFVNWVPRARPTLKGLGLSSLRSAALVLPNALPLLPALEAQRIACEAGAIEQVDPATLRRMVGPQVTRLTLTHFVGLGRL